uniref:Uncharacterized protein n=1 Tax=Lactuca sativa TaxID=4236 RepID=A0A9R1XUL3_LACSA|nr:hypothetical protein LSAT_V11C100032300 [Lactuca sativa]
MPDSLEFEPLSTEIDGLVRRVAGGGKSEKFPAEKKCCIRQKKSSKYVGEFEGEKRFVAYLNWDEGEQKVLLFAATPLAETRDPFA